MSEAMTSQDWAWPNQPSPPTERVVYVSGPMTGKKDFNKGAFRNAQLIGEARGYTMLVPGQGEVYSEEETATWTASPANRETWLRRDVDDILCSDEVWVLPGWSNSRGSTFEVLIALELGIRVTTKWSGDLERGVIKWRVGLGPFDGSDPFDG